MKQYILDKMMSVFKLKVTNAIDKAIIWAQWTFLDISL